MQRIVLTNGTRLGKRQKRMELHIETIGRENRNGGTLSYPRPKIYCKMRSKPVKYSRKMSCTVRHCEDLSSVLSPSFCSFLRGICRNMASFGENMAVLSSLSTEYTEILCSYSPILDVYERFCLYVEVRKCPENRKDRVRILAVLN